MVGDRRVIGVCRGRGVGGFLGKIGRFPGDIREKGCLMSGAAARTGKANRKRSKWYCKKIII